MSVSNYTLLDVVNVIGFRAGNFKVRLDTVENPDLATIQIIECVNDALRAIFRVKSLPHTNRRASITTMASYKDGTVTTVQGSATVTGIGTAWTSAMAGAGFATMAINSTYRIAGVSSPTQLVLDAPWAGDSITTAVGYVIAQDRYALPSDFYDFISVNIEGEFTRYLEIHKPSEMDWHRSMMLGKILDPGSPRRITVFDRDPNSGNWMVELDIFPDKPYRLQLRYRGRLQRLRRDSDVVPLPDEHIDIMYDGAVQKWKEATGAAEPGSFMQWVNGALGQWAAFDQRSTDETPHLVPNTSRSERPVVGPLDWGPNG